MPHIPSSDRVDLTTGKIEISAARPEWILESEWPAALDEIVAHEELHRDNQPPLTLDLRDELWDFTVGDVLNAWKALWEARIYQLREDQGGNTGLLLRAVTVPGFEEGDCEDEYTRVLLRNLRRVPPAPGCEAERLIESARHMEDPSVLIAEFITAVRNRK